MYYNYICFFIFIGTNKDYTIAKGDVALEKVNALQSNIRNLDPDVDTSKLNDIELKRNICVAGIIASVIGVIICCIIMYSKSNKAKQTIIQTQHINNLIQSKLQELEQIYKNNHITQEEYDNKRKKYLKNYD